MVKQSVAALVAVGVGLAFGGSVLGQSTGTSPPSAAAVSAADKKFIMNAARGGMAEVKLGQLAVKSASSDAVKQFGQRMVDDHSKANDELKQLAGQKGVTLPTSIGKQNQSAYSHLAKLSGASFDHAYMQHMVKDHEMDVREFEKEASSGKDPDVKAWAEKTVPTLRAHLEMARGIATPVSAH